MLPIYKIKRFFHIVLYRNSVLEENTFYGRFFVANSNVKHNVPREFLFYEFVGNL